MQDQSGRTVSFQYTKGILSGATNANGNQSTFAYTSAGSAAGLLTAESAPPVTLRCGRLSTQAGRVASQADSLGNEMTLAWAAGSGSDAHQACGVHPYVG